MLMVFSKTEDPRELVVVVLKNLFYVIWYLERQSLTSGIWTRE